MPAPIRITWDNAGMNALVNSRDMSALCRASAEAARLHAISISPRSTRKRKVHYQDSFVVRKTTLNDARGGRRAGAILANVADHAGAVEWGTEVIGRKPTKADNILSRTVSFIEGGRLMGYVFPNVREAFYELVPRAQDGLTPYYQLTIDFAERLPAALIYRVGGSESGPFREDRINVDIYANGSTEANGVADDVRAFLAGTWHDADGILLDQVEVEVVPTEIPYPSDTVNLVSATYRVATRAT